MRRSAHPPRNFRKVTLLRLCKARWWHSEARQLTDRARGPPRPVRAVWRHPGSAGGEDHGPFGINPVQSLREARARTVSRCLLRCCGSGANRSTSSVAGCTGGSFRGRDACFVVNDRMRRSVRTRSLRRQGQRHWPAVTGMTLLPGVRIEGGGFTASVRPQARPAAPAGVAARH
jgi:hypothetical protein